MLQLQINGLSEIAMLILCFLDFRLLTPETTLLLLRPWRMDMWRFVVIIIIIIFIIYLYFFMVPASTICSNFYHTFFCRCDSFNTHQVK